MTTAVQLQGACDPRFTQVRDAFAENFAARGEVGAAVCVYVDGAPVADLRGGHADAARTKPWGRNTVEAVYASLGAK